MNTAFENGHQEKDMRYLKYDETIILVTAPVETRSGYGNHARDICRALIESDKYDVVIQSVRWGSTPLNALDKNNPSHKEIQKEF